MIASLFESLTWWYPFIAWGLVVGAIARAVQHLSGDRGWRWIPLAAGCLVFLPIAGLPIARWLHGYCANLSIPLAAWLLHVVLSPLLSRPLLDEREERHLGWFGFLMGCLLFPAALGLGTVDPYVLGWRSWGIALGLALPTGLLLWHGERLGYVLFAAALAWQAGLLESNNAWDYGVDPILWVISASILIQNAARHGLPVHISRRRQPMTPALPPNGSLGQ